MCLSGVGSIKISCFKEYMLLPKPITISISKSIGNLFFYIYVELNILSVESWLRPCVKCSCFHRPQLRSTSQLSFFGKSDPSTVLYFFMRTEKMVSFFLLF